MHTAMAFVVTKTHTESISVIFNGIQRHDSRFAGLTPTSSFCSGKKSRYTNPILCFNTGHRNRSQMTENGYSGSSLVKLWLRINALIYHLSSFYA